LGRFLDKTVFSSVLILLILGEIFANFFNQKIEKKGRKKKKKTPWALWTGIHTPNAKFY
jgi:hypothetical protein